MKTVFDKRKEYSDYIADKVDEVMKLCHLYKIPMFVTVCVKNDEKHTVYEKEMVSAATCGYELTDNQIAKHVNVSLGFDTIQPSSEMELEMEDAELDYIESEEEENDEE